jgi:Ca2+-binding EF-hand superfamily protein
LALAEPLDKPEPSASIRDLVFWGAGGPIRMRLHLQINGRPADAVWSEAVKALFTFCDRNHDGVLDAAELGPFTEPRIRNQQLILDQARQPALRLSFDDRKAKVSLAQFDAALRSAGFDPVNLMITQAQPNSQRLSAALFQRLDRDGDGKLSQPELFGARARMEFFDTNEDELITVAELLGRTETNPRRRVASQRASPADSTNAPQDLVLLSEDHQAAFTQIVAARGDAKNKVIRKADFGGDDKTFAALDKNGDGRLDAAEWEAWLKQPPDLEIRFSLGSPSQPDAHAVLSKRVGDKVVVDSRPPGEINASWGTKVSFRFEPPNRGESESAAWKRTEEQLRKQLKAPADKAPPVPRRVLTNQLDLAAFSAFASPTADGKVGPAEAAAALKVLGQLAGCRLVLAVRDQGAGLFEILDRNSDGQLGPRELVDAPERLKPFADATGKVGPNDLPRRFVIAVSAGSIPAVLSTTPTAPAVKQIQVRQDLPAWFTNMDRNGDGEVSLREFLGPVELFRKLDKNGDGLISPDEARAAKLDR